MRENAGKMRTRITPNTDNFYAVDTITSKLIINLPLHEKWSKCDSDSFIYSEDFLTFFFFLSRVIENNEDLVPNSFNRN